MLTEKQIQAAVRTATGVVVLNDSASGRGIGSLRLRIRPGSRGTTSTWFAWWQADGKAVTKTLGRYPDLGLADARRRYEAEVRDVLLDGRNPNAVIIQTETPTVQALFKGYIQALKDKGAATWDESERLLLTGKFNATAYLGKDKPASSVEPADIAALLSKGMKRGARRTTDMQRTAMAAAFTWGMWYGLNPLPVSSFKGRPKSTADGATFRGEEYAGAFVGRSKAKGKQSIFKRVRDERLPVAEQLHPIEDKAVTFIEDEVFDQVLDIFWKHFQRDLRARVKFQLGES